MARLFVSQDQMDRWTSEGRVRIDDDLMSLPALGRSFRLETAVYFSAMVDGADVRDLLGRVKTPNQIRDLGGEPYGSSAIFGETAYECVEGFLGIPVDTPNLAASGLLRLDP